MTRDSRKRLEECNLSFVGTDLKNKSRSTTHRNPGRNWREATCVSLLRKLAHVISQSTTHIDPQVGTGGMLRDQVDFGKAGKYRHLLAACLTKGQVYV